MTTSAYHSIDVVRENKTYIVSAIYTPAGNELARVQVQNKPGWLKRSQDLLLAKVGLMSDTFCVWFPVKLPKP